MLILATLACSLTRAEDPDPTAEPTIDFDATLDAPVVVNETTGPPPSVTIQQIDPAAPIELGSTVLIDVAVTHDRDLTTLILEIARTDNLPSGQAAQFETASTIEVAPGTTSVEEQFRWQPFDAGNFLIVVNALAQGPLGTSPEIPVEIVTPVIVETTDSAVGGAAAPQPEPCIITPAEGSVTIRSASTDNSSNVGSLGEGQQGTAIALGRDASWQGWYQIELAGGVRGYVKGTLVNSEGDCTPGVHLRLQQ